jgi:hypothetical protein
MRFGRGLALFLCAGLSAFGGSCVAEVDADDESVGAAEQELGPPSVVCVDSIACGGCCGNVHQIQALVACCDRGDGFDCAARFGCR